MPVSTVLAGGSLAGNVSSSVSSSASSSRSFTHVTLQPMRPDAIRLSDIFAARKQAVDRRLDAFGGLTPVRRIPNRTAYDDVVGSAQKRLRDVDGPLLIVLHSIHDRPDTRNDNQEARAMFTPE